MILLELIDWLWEHRGEFTLTGLLLFFTRKIIIHELKTLLQLGGNEELTWTRERVERLTGETFHGHPTVSGEVRRNSRQLFKLLRRAIRMVIQSRRRRNMPTINKNWLAGIIVYFLTLIVSHYNLNLPQGWENEAFTFALYGIQGLAFLAVAWWDKLHHITPPPKPVYTPPTPQTYEQLKPIIKSVHEGVNALYADVQSGKKNDTLQEAITLYNQLNTVLQQRKAGGTDAGSQSQ